MDHLGLGAGMYAARGLGAGLDRPLQHTPETRLVPVGRAVKAMVLTGLGVVHPQLSLVPMFFQTTPTQRLVAPGIDAPHLQDETWGRAFATLYAAGVTARSRLIAVPAAPCRGLTPTVAHRDRPSGQGDGHDNRGAAPAEHVRPMPRGARRAHRPARPQVRLDVRGAHQAGIPVLLHPLSGHTRDARAVGPLVTQHRRPLPATDGPTGLVADSALSSAEHRRQRADPGGPGMTRVPAPVTEAPNALEPVPLEARVPRQAGDRSHGRAAIDGGVAPRGVVLSSAPRRPQAQRTVDHHWRRQREGAVQAWQTLCRPACAGEADARPARASVTQGVPPTTLAARRRRSRPPSSTRGRPGQGAPPEPVVDPIAGALVSAIAAHDALVAQPSGFSLAPNVLDDHTCPPLDLLAGYHGQKHGERGGRGLTEPGFWAASRALKTPARLRALLLVMPVCWLV